MDNSGGIQGPGKRYQPLSANTGFCNLLQDYATGSETKEKSGW